MGRGQRALLSFSGDEPAQLAPGEGALVPVLRTGTRLPDATRCEAVLPVDGSVEAVAGFALVTEAARSRPRKRRRCCGSATWIDRRRRMLARGSRHCPYGPRERGRARHMFCSAGGLLSAPVFVLWVHRTYQRAPVAGLPAVGPEKERRLRRRGEGRGGTASWQHLLGCQRWPRAPATSSSTVKSVVKETGPLFLVGLRALMGKRVKNCMSRRLWTFQEIWSSRRTGGPLVRGSLMAARR